jgi:SAM-dependent methyltransferase
MRAGRRFLAINTSFLPTFCSSPMLRFAPDVALHPSAGRWLIQRGDSDSARVWCDSPTLLSWLLQFNVPCDPDLALRAFAARDQVAVRHWLDQLCSAGILQPDAEAPAEVIEPDMGQTIALMPAIASALYDLSADLQGLGEFARQAFKAPSLHSQVRALGESVQALRQALHPLRGPHLNQQAQQLGIGANSQNLRLHLGCGPVHIPGFVNIDIAPAPMAMNVLWGMPFEDGQAEIVYLSHLLEHLFYPRDVMALLKELFRVLKPGGMIRVVVPDMARCVQAYQAQDHAFFDARRAHFSWWPENASMLENFLTYAGVGAEPGFLFESHKYGYDLATLAKALAGAGFQRVERSAYQQSAHPALRVEDQSPAANWQVGDDSLSLFVEAYK